MAIRIVTLFGKGDRKETSIFDRSFDLLAAWMQESFERDTATQYFYAMENSKPIWRVSCGKTP